MGRKFRGQSGSPCNTKSPQSRPGDFVLDGDPAPLPKTGAEPPNFRPMFIIVIVISLEHCTDIIGLFKFKFKFKF